MSVRHLRGTYVLYRWSGHGRVRSLLRTLLVRT